MMPSMPGTNLTRDEAAARAALLDVASYVIDLDLTTSDTTFASTTTIRFTCREPGAATFADLVAHVRSRAVLALDHEDIPFDRVVDALRPERSLAHAPLFQVNFVLNNAPEEALVLPGIALQALSPSAGSARFDLVVAMTEGHDGFAGTLTYRSDLFEDATARRNPVTCAPTASRWQPYAVSTGSTSGGCAVSTGSTSGCRHPVVEYDAC